MTDIKIAELEKSLASANSKIEDLKKSIRAYNTNNNRYWYLVRTISNIAETDFSVQRARLLLSSLTEDGFHDKPANKIHLKNGKTLLVDDEQYEYISKLMDDVEKLKKG